MKTRELDLGGPVNVADHGGDGPPILCLHGLGASHTSWMAVGDALARRGRVLSPDLIGFGRTPLAGREPSIEANVAMLGWLLVQEAHEPAVVIGNSMGGLVAVMLAATRPERVSRLVLVSPALHRPLGTPVDLTVAAMFASYMIPVVAEHLMRKRLAEVGPERMLRDTMRLCGVDPSKVMPAAWEASLAIAHERAKLPWIADAFLGAARSLVRTVSHRERMDDAVRRVAAPTLVTHGTRDRLVPIEVSLHAASVRPGWRVERMEGVGHTPQIEVPERWLDIVTTWLG